MKDKLISKPEKPEKPEKSEKLEKPDGVKVFPDYIYTTKASTDKIKKIIQKDNSNFVITGASISYNRYSFEKVSRKNAYECSPGILSWSFMLRDAIKQNDIWYKFGNEIEFHGCETFNGIFPEGYPSEEEKYLCVNHGKVKGLIIENQEQIIRFYYQHNNINSNKAVLYMQKRGDSLSCEFDLFLNDKIIAKGLSNKGCLEKYQGFELWEVLLPIGPSKEVHEISIKNIKPLCREKAIINIAGVGTRKANIYLTGRGSQTVDFFIDNLDERILKFKPEILFLTTGANDIGRVSKEVFLTNLKKVAREIKKHLPNCEIIFIGPPCIEQYPYEQRQEFINTIRQAAIDCNSSFINLEKLFDGIPINKWRFDNVHLNKFGNTMLARTIVKTFFPDEIQFKEEIIDAEFWSDM